jgi:ribose 5-phosphate isomerase
MLEMLKEFVVVADHRKNSRQLGDQWKYVPIEVLPMAWTQVPSHSSLHFTNIFFLFLCPTEEESGC